MKFILLLCKSLAKKRKKGNIPRLFFNINRSSLWRLSNKFNLLRIISLEMLENLHKLENDKFGFLWTLHNHINKKKAVKALSRKYYRKKRMSDSMSKSCKFNKGWLWRPYKCHNGWFCKPQKYYVNWKGAFWGLCKFEDKLWGQSTRIAEILNATLSEAGR